MQEDDAQHAIEHRQAQVRTVCEDGITQIVSCYDEALVIIIAGSV